MDADCVQLSIEGERLLKQNDYKGAIEFFEAALRAGTEDSQVLSAVYNQLGNACFYCGQFSKALEYHKADLQIAESLGDKEGMAKAHGNLGNTFKSLKDYGKAVMHCETHLDLTRQLNNKFGEGRACYNLGNVFHAHGKAMLTSRDAEEQKKGRDYILKAIEYYKSTLEITTALNDIAGEGRAVGNLGNAYTAIGNYHDAIKQHKRRYEIAVQANDLAAKARACGNLGNAYSALGDYIDAINYYQQSLQVAREDRNLPAQGQAYFCLGCTYNLQKNYVKGIEHHRKYLDLVTQLNDATGKMRAWHNLRNTFGHMKNIKKKIEYHELIRAEQRRRGDDVYPLLPEQLESLDADEQNKKKDKKKGIFKPKKKAGDIEEFSVADSDDDDDIVTTRSRPNAGTTSKKGNAADRWLQDTIEESKRSNNQPTSVNPPGFTAPAPTAPKKKDSADMPFDLFDMLAQANHNSFNDQRAPVKAPGTLDPAPFDNSARTTANGTSTMYDGEEDFFDMIASFQSHKLDNQRSTLAGEVKRNAGPISSLSDGSDATTGDASAGKSLQDQLDPEGMSFFEMLAVAKNS